MTTTEAILIAWGFTATAIALNYYLRYRQCYRSSRERAVRSIIREMNKSEDE